MQSHIENKKYIQIHIGNLQDKFDKQDFEKVNLNELES